MRDNAALRTWSLTINGRKTSISLEEGFWQELKWTAQDRQSTLSEIIREIKSTDPDNLSSAVRVFVLNHLLQWPEEAVSNRAALKLL
jgi:predicted DNA-binding ribbon-helix-helix protein